MARRGTIGIRGALAAAASAVVLSGSASAAPTPADLDACRGWAHAAVPTPAAAPRPDAPRVTEEWAATPPRDLAGTTGTTTAGTVLGMPGTTTPGLPGTVGARLAPAEPEPWRMAVPPERRDDPEFVRAFVDCVRGRVS
jgi:hypothetical protein